VDQVQVVVFKRARRFEGVSVVEEGSVVDPPCKILCTVNSFPRIWYMVQIHLQEIETRMSD
jgi:hypothetical protein